MKKLLFVLVIVSFLISACGGAEATPTPAPTNTPVPPTALPSTPTPQPIKNISYKGSYVVDVHLPEAADGPFPTLLLLHDWTLTKRSLEPLAAYLSERGYATVSANWLTGAYPPDGSMFPNAFCALAWIHTNAETYGFDPQRIAVFGHLAGGHAATLVGIIDETTELMEGCPHQLPASDWTKAVVTYVGLFGTQEYYLSQPTAFGPNKTIFDIHAEKLELSPEETTEIHQNLMDTPPQSWRDISGLSEKGTQLLHSLPPYWVDGSEPPFLLIHGKKAFDGAGAEAFAVQLQAAGVEAKLLILPDAGLSDIVYPRSSGFEDAVQAMEAFLTEVLE